MLTFIWQLDVPVAKFSVLTRRPFLSIILIWSIDFKLPGVIFVALAADDTLVPVSITDATVTVEDAGFGDMEKRP